MNGSATVSPRHLLGSRLGAKLPVTAIVLREYASTRNDFKFASLALAFISFELCLSITSWAWSAFSLLRLSENLHSVGPARPWVRFNAM